MHPGVDIDYCGNISSSTLKNECTRAITNFKKNGRYAPYGPYIYNGIKSAN